MAKLASQGNSYIIRFPSAQALNQFRAEMDKCPPFRRGRIVYGQFTPDVIVTNVSDATLARIRRLAHPQAQFFEDIQFEISQRL